MAELRYRAGNIRNPEVHKVGIIALGSHLENHGPALPIDTDAKIGAHIAFQSSLLSGAKFLGIIFPAYELDTIDHGVHVSLDELKENVINTLNQAKKFLTSGNKVRVVLKFKGREMSHQAIGRELLERFQADASEVGQCEKKPVLDGRFMSMIINPLSNKSK